MLTYESMFLSHFYNCIFWKDNNGIQFDGVSKMQKKKKKQKNQQGFFPSTSVNKAVLFALWVTVL